MKSNPGARWTCGLALMGLALSGALLTGCGSSSAGTPAVVTVANGTELTNETVSDAGAQTNGTGGTGFLLPGTAGYFYTAYDVSASVAGTYPITVSSLPPIAGSGFAILNPHVVILVPSTTGPSYTFGGASQEVSNATSTSLTVTVAAGQHFALLVTSTTPEEAGPYDITFGTGLVVAATHLTIDPNSLP